MFNPSRDEARRFLIDAWAKYRAGEPLSDLERDRRRRSIALHPEYHAMLEHPERNRRSRLAPEAGDVNPFLHLSLHLAVAEQLAIDQPPGIRARIRAIRAARGDEHAALHAVLECLGEVIWQAQRHGTPPDARALPRLPRAAAMKQAPAGAVAGDVADREPISTAARDASPAATA